MAESDHGALVEEYIESVWNQGDIEALDRLTSTGFSYFLGGHAGRDRSGMGEFLAVTHRAFPDWRVTPTRVISEGNMVAVQWEGTVTHGGDFHGTPATGKKIAVSGINLYQIEEGLILSEWEQMDTIGMLQQLGIGG